MNIYDHLATQDNHVTGTSQQQEQVVETPTEPTEASAVGSVTNKTPSSGSRADIQETAPEEQDLTEEYQRLMTIYDQLGQAKKETVFDHYGHSLMYNEQMMNSSIAGNKEKRKINAYGFNLGDSGLQKLSRALKITCQDLSVLNLGSNGISDKGMKYLFSSDNYHHNTKDHKNIIEGDLSRQSSCSSPLEKENKRKDRMFKANEQMSFSAKTINLNNNCISDKGIEHLKEWIEGKAKEFTSSLFFAAFLNFENKQKP